MRNIRKYITVCLALLLLLPALTGCSPEGVIYRSSSVLLEEAEPLSSITYLSEDSCLAPETKPVTGEKLYNKSVIFVGEVTAVREVRKTCREPGTDSSQTSYITLMDVSVVNTLYHDGTALPKTVTVGIPNSTRAYIRGTPQIEVGKTLLLFGWRSEVYAEQINDHTELEKYTDIWISSCEELMVEKTDRGYLSCIAFINDAVPEDKKVKVTEDMADMTELLAASSGRYSDKYNDAIELAYCVDPQAFEEIIRQQVQSCHAGQQE